MRSNDGPHTTIVCVVQVRGVVLAADSVFGKRSMRPTHIRDGICVGDGRLINASCEGMPRDYRPCMSFSK